MAAERPLTAPARAARPGDVVAGRYELVELVGSGGMSSVYKARDRLLERNVALKLLHPHYGDDDEYVERFRREARSVAQLSHPGIVTVIDRGADEGRQYIVFEYVDGESLKQLIERCGPLPPRRAVELAVAIAEALAFAHEHGLVHRDVKPQNVLLTADGEPRVTDFGIARSLDVEHGVTQTGTVLGTSNYLSPEQATGKPVTPSTDVYSLGVVLYELLTGEVPFPGENFVAVAMKHLNEPVPDVTEMRSDLPPRLVGALERALAKDPSQRFGSMDQFAWELRQCLAELGPGDDERTVVVRSPLVREGRPYRARGGRRRWPLYALAVLVAAGATVGAVLGLDGSSGGQTPAKAEAKPGPPVRLSGVGAYDPQGGDGEHDDIAARATDGDEATYWNTEHYRAFTKNGVGVVLDAGSRVALSTVTVASGTPGFTAEITVGDSPNGPFVTDSRSQVVQRRATFSLQGRRGRYWVVWITGLGPNESVEINEVTARS